VGSLILWQQFRVCSVSTGRREFGASSTPE